MSNVHEKKRKHRKETHTEHRGKVHTDTHIDREREREKGDSLSKVESQFDKDEWIRGKEEEYSSKDSRKSLSIPEEGGIAKKWRGARNIFARPRIFAAKGWDEEEQQLNDGV